MMAEDSTTPDLVELDQRFLEANNRRDLDAVMSFFAPDAVWDSSQWGVGVFEGCSAIRRFIEDWIASYDAWEHRMEENKDLGNGVSFAVTLQHGRLAASNAALRERWSYTALWEAGVISRMIVRNDIGEARAAAERLAEERG